MPTSNPSPAVAHAIPERFPEELPGFASGVVIGLCAAKLLLHLLISVQHYGYFRDELYYLDMARHLDWGYVNAAPPSTRVRSGGTTIIGTSAGRLFLSEEPRHNFAQLLRLCL